jgi:flagellar hook assembly protein FlgD
LASNWHSAASDVGYGTPTFKNSQMKSSDLFLGEVSLDLNLFSPDNDGYEDFTTLLYHFPEQGNVMNIIIYDAEGRVVKYLQQSTLAGITGNFRWDGLDEKGRRLPSGIYIVLTEVFNISGKKKVFKNVTALAYKY